MRKAVMKYHKVPLLFTASDGLVVLLLVPLLVVPNPFLLLGVLSGDQQWDGN